jgi:hypothetical protein
MNFKQWLLLKEDPESPGVDPGDDILKHYSFDRNLTNPLSYNDEDALSFGLLHNYYLYGDSSWEVWHRDILNYLWTKINRQSFNDDDSMKDIETLGNMNPVALNQLKDWLEYIKTDIASKRDRFVSISRAPDFILGRIWTKRKVISFWNKKESVFKNSNDVINFIKFFGDPQDYIFELQNFPITYEDFLNKTTLTPITTDSSKETAAARPKFDPSKLHVLDPAIKGQVMKMGSSFKLPIGPGIKTRQKAFTSESILK